MNERDFYNSKAFHARIRKTGAILKDKPYNVAKELHQIKDKYFDFGKLYTGKKTYSIKSENPAEAGPHN